MNDRTTNPPRPGARVRGSQTGRPVMALLDLLGRRWVLRILWELRGEPLNFRALQAACGGISPSVLNTRLAELRESLLVEARTDEGYTLTKTGRELLTQLTPLTVWSEKWAKALK
ncbi:MAG: helix-turn-helix domain-containing protein [Parvibaculum sp.]|jgi:DNA-binding HxlR family transcriptional regulator|uniref:winged helix-turn-helix transcriptional regulator n=1 Tax=Parvibaculum sp. TaxID=2024848 RepID=UPI003267BAB3